VLPSVSTETGESGLACSTASTAAVSTSKSRGLRSNPLVSAVSTAASDRVPDCAVAA
jgi:hypothetical protein